MYLLSHPSEFVYLIVSLFLKLSHLDFQVVYAQLVKHHYIVIPVVNQQTLKTYAAQTVLAKSFYIFLSVYLALAIRDIRLVVRQHAIAHLV